MKYIVYIYLHIGKKTSALIVNTLYLPGKQFKSLKTLLSW